VNTARDEGLGTRREVAEVLAELGLSASLTARGFEGEVAVVSAPAAEYDKLFGPTGAELVRRLKRLGFRYVALDLSPLSAQR
jgi:PP-loop superfamily ATP-utilizing enzyme